MRWRCLLAGLWTGMLVTVAAIATPAPFAVLPSAEAGRVVARVLASEAYASLAAASLLCIVDRHLARDGGPAFGADLMLVLGALFCTVLGYFALQPLMEAARAGSGAWSFGALHGASVIIYGFKLLLVALLFWRSAGVSRSGVASISPPQGSS